MFKHKQNNLVVKWFVDNFVEFLCQTMNYIAFSGSFNFHLKINWLLSVHIFDSRVQPKYKSSDDDILLPCGIAYSLFLMEECSLTQAEIHKMASHCYYVNFLSASIISFPLTRLWKFWNESRRALKFWYDIKTSMTEKEKKRRYFWFSDPVIPINNELFLKLSSGSVFFQVLPLKSNKILTVEIALIGIVII